METAKLNVGYASVTSPISCRAGLAQVTEGALVGQGEATLLTTVQQIDPIYLTFTQSSTEVMRLQQALKDGKLAKAGGDAAKVTLVTEDGRAYAQTGKLYFSDLTVDPATGTITLRAIVPNADRTLLPGMYVRARLEQAVDEPDDRTPNFCFIDDVRNHDVRARSRNAVQHWLNRFRGETEDGPQQRTKAAKKLLLQIREVSQLLQTLLYMTSGACGRGTEMAEMSVRNTQTNPLRSFFFMNGKMVCMPTHTKLMWNQFMVLRTVSRHPDRVTAMLYKLFVVLCMPVRGVLQQVDHVESNDANAFLRVLPNHEDGAAPTFHC